MTASYTKVSIPFFPLRSSVFLWAASRHGWLSLYKRNHTVRDDVRPVENITKALLEAEDYELSCEECFNLLVLYADVLVEGGDPQEVVAKVKRHLKQCGRCNQELEALLGKMHDIAANNPPESPFSPE